MRTFLSTIILLLLFITPVLAQYKAVTFDYEKVVFGENQPLPAESHIMLQGEVETAIQIVEIDIFDHKGKENRLPLYTNKWKRSNSSDNKVFMLPINFRLKNNTEYDFKIKYYTGITGIEQKVLNKNIKNYLALYLEQVIIINRNNLSLKQSETQIMRSLNGIVYKGLQLHKNHLDMSFSGFSDLVKLKLQQIKKASLSKGKAIFQDKDKDAAKIAYRDKLLLELETMLHTELDQYMDMSWYKLADVKYVDNYSTEKGKRTINLQAGFGGAYLSSSSQSLSLGAAPFAGFAFPLSQRPKNSKFLSNLSIIFGMFILDFEGPNNTRFSGPIFKRPTYVGASYKLFRFVHLNAGITFLEDISTAGQLAGIENNVFIRPFIGVSAQINLWVDFSK
jgi:hypothetical protein